MPLSEFYDFCGVACWILLLVGVVYHLWDV